MRMLKCKYCFDWKISLNGFLLLLTVYCGILASCSEDDPLPGLTGEKIDYALMAFDGSGISGTATFEEREDHSAKVTISLSGTTSGNSHPAHIHLNTAAEGGDIAINLTNIDGTTGMSVTEISSMNNGAAITYDALLAFDGYINVHHSTADLSIVSQADIGQNALTGNSKEYSLSEIDESGIEGTATFYERVSGESLVVIAVTGDAIDSNHPMHIHANTAAEGGSIIITLTNLVNGLSKTNVTQMDNLTTISYTQLIAIDGYINIHQSVGDLSVVSQGDVGQNALTGTHVTYTLNEINDSGLSGTAAFWKRENNETLVVIELTGDASDSNHPMHIHANSAAEGGAIVITLTNVVNGKSKTNVTKKDDMAAITYDGMIVFDGYINVHNTPGDLSVVAQGDIGANAE